jgi:tetratricopeptide (TPR) repeat protein
MALQAPVSTLATAPPRQSAFVPAIEPTNSYVPSASAQEKAYVPQQPPVNPFQPSPTPPLPTLPAPTQQTAAMLPVVQQAQQMSNQAATMAQRGMFYSAKTELIKALTLISQSLDVQQGTATHTAALTAGLTALEEARDFAASGGQKSGSNVITIAATHQTKLPTPIEPGVSPVVAQQQYFGFAQNQLTIAAGGLPASSDILYRLGRLQTAFAAHDNDPTTLHGPQAIVFHQTALATDANNWLAANELGVLYARYGQLPQARQLLVQSVMLHPHRQGWHNLAAVHRRLGESDLAQRAEAEVQLFDKQPGQATDANDMVRWVDPKTFAASSGGDANWPATVAAKPAAGSGSTRR